MPNNNTAPTWDDTQDVSVPSFDETTPIEEQKTEQPLTYMQQELRRLGHITDDIKLQEAQYPLSYKESDKIKTPDFMGLLSEGSTYQPTGVMKSISEGASKAVRPIEDKFASYVDKKKMELTGGVPLPNPLDPQYNQKLDDYTRVLRENPMAAKEDKKITAIRMLIDQSKQAQKTIDDYKSTEGYTGVIGEPIENISKVTSGIKKGLEDYGRVYFELANNLDKNLAVKDLDNKFELNKKGELELKKGVVLDEGDNLLLQAVAENNNKAKQLESIDPTAFNIGKMAGESLGFTGEFLLTGGIGAGAAKAITKGVAAKVAEGAAVSTAKKLGVGLSAKMAQTGIQVAAMPTFYKGVAEGVSSGENFGESLLKNYYRTFGENFTERIFLKNPWSKGTVGAVDGFMSKLGVNMHTEKGLVGILASTAEEATEEKIGELMTAPLDYNNFNDFWKDYWDVQKNKELIGSIAVMTVPMGLVSYSAKKYDDVQLNRIGKLLPSGVRSEIDQVLDDKKLTLKEQYDLVGKIVEDNATNKTLGDNPAEAAGNIIRYTQQKTKSNVVSAVEERAQTPTVGTREEITTEDQAKLDYLESKGVKVPDGSTMEAVNSLYEQEKQKEPSIVTEEAKQGTEIQPITEEIKPTEAISASVEVRSAKEAPIAPQEQKEPSMAQNIEEELPSETSMSSLENTIVSYDGVKGRLTKEDNGYFVTDENGERYFVERGESGLSPEELGVYKENELPTYNPEDSSIDYLGNKYTYESANTDKNGDTVSINVIDESGKKKTIRNKFVVEEVEYQKALSEMEQSDGLNAITEQNITDAAKELNIKTHEEAGIAKTVEPIQQERPIEAPEKAPTEPKQVTRQRQPTVVGEQIRVEQQKQLENGKEIRGDEAKRQRRQERLLRVQEIDNELGDVWSNLADIVGAKISLTGEQRPKIMPVVSQLAKLYTEKYALKGMDLVDQIIEHLTSKGINVDEETINQITQEYAREIREKDKGDPGAQEGVVEGQKRKVSVGDNGKDKKTPRREDEEVGNNASHYGIRWAWGKNASKEASQQYREKGLYFYGKTESQAEIAEAGKYIVDNNTDKHIEDVIKDEEVSRRLRLAVSTYYVKELDSRVNDLISQGKTKEANEVVNDIMRVMKGQQDKIATETGRDLSFFNSVLITSELGSYSTARLAQMGMEKSSAKRESAKSYKKIRDIASKELSDANNEAIEETINKVVKPKIQESKVVDPRIKEIRNKRNSLFDAWKKARESKENTYSTIIPGLTQVDIDYGGRIALTYIEEGFYKTEDLIKKLKKAFKRVGLEIDEEQAKALIPSKVGDTSIEEYQKSEELKDASEALANKIFGDVIDKKAPKDDPIKKMVETLFSKFKDTQLERTKGVKPNPSEKLAAAIRNAKEYKSVWDAAKKDALDLIKDSKTLTPEQKEQATKRVNDAYEKATEFTFSDKMVKDLIKGQLKKEEIDLADVTRDYLRNRDAVKEKLKTTLVNEFGFTDKEADTFKKSIDSAFETLVADKSRKIIDKYVNKKTRKPSRKQVKGVDEILQLANTGAFDSAEFRAAFAKAWGIGSIDETDFKYIKDRAEAIQNIKSGTIRFEEKQKLLAYISNLDGMDWGELLSGFWYANVLSGVGTQIKNIMDGTLSAVVEPLIIANPKRLKRAVKSIGRTVTGRAATNWWHTINTGIHPFDIDTSKPKLDVKILNAQDALVANKAAWKGIKASVQAQAKVLEFMLANDSFNGSIAYEGILDAIITNYVFGENAKRNANGLPKETKEQLNRKIDEMLKITPEDQAIINKQIESESEEYKKVQAKLGQEETGYSKEQKSVRFYEIMDEMRPLEFVTEAKKLAMDAIGNTDPYGTLGWAASLVTQVNELKFKLYKPILVKTKEGRKLAFSPTNSTTITPTRFIIPFTRIITALGSRNLNYHALINPIRLAAGKYGVGMQYSDRTKRFVRELTKEEKVILKKKLVAVASISVLAYFLSGGDDPDNPIIGITGAGAGDKDKNKQLRETGWKPWSLMIGGKTISYQYIPGLNIILMPTGWARDKQRYRGGDKSFAGFLKYYMEGLVVSLGQILFSTPLSGINTAMSIIGDATKGMVESAGAGVMKLGASIGGGFLEPRALDDFVKGVEKIDAMATKTKIIEYEPQTFLETLGSLVPFVGKNLSGKIEMLDILGNNINKGMSTQALFGSIDKDAPDYELKKWLIEDVNYFRPSIDFKATKIRAYEKNGLINVARGFTAGSKEDEAMFTELNKTAGRLFKERAIAIRDKGLEPEKAKDELERAWGRSREDAIRQMYLYSQDHPLPVTEIK